MIDLNMPEIIVLIVLAVIMFGPEKLPELARKLARIIAYLRKVGNDARGQLRQELGPEFDNIRLSDLANPKSFVARQLAGTALESELNDAKAELSSAGQLMRSTLDDGRQSMQGAADEVRAGTDAEPAPDDAAPIRVVAFDPEAT